MGVKMFVWVPCSEETFATPEESKTCDRIVDELIRRGLGTPRGGLIGSGRIAFDFDFNASDELTARQQIALVFDKIAPHWKYTATVIKDDWPKNGED